MSLRAQETAERLWDRPYNPAEDYARPIRTQMTDAEKIERLEMLVADLALKVKRLMIAMEVRG